MSGHDVSPRVSHRVESDPAKYLRRAPNRGESRDDSSPKHGRGRQPASRLDSITPTLTEQDIAVIDVLSFVRMASGNQLNRLLWPTTPAGRRACQRHLKRLTELRILTRLHRRVGGIKSGSQGFTYALDVNGQRIAQTRHHNTIRRPTPSDFFVDHTLAITETYVVLATTENIELLDWTPEPDCWRTFSGPAGRTVTLRPDAFIRWAIGDWELCAFVEVDRATEHPGRIVRKADQYVRYWRTGTEQRIEGVFPTVLWLTPTEQRASVLRQALDGHESEPLSTVITSDSFPDFITNTREEGTS